MLLCGFEKFNNFYIRIDILERLFMKIINSNSDKKIKIIPEMLNLLGCSKENFINLLKNMNYKIIHEDSEVFFKYAPKKNIKKPGKKIDKESPFGVLKNLNLN